MFSNANKSGRDWTLHINRVIEIISSATKAAVLTRSGSNPAFGFIIVHADTFFFVSLSLSFDEFCMYDFKVSASVQKKERKEKKESLLGQHTERPCLLVTAEEASCIKRKATRCLPLLKKLPIHQSDGRVQVLLLQLLCSLLICTLVATFCLNLLMDAPLVPVDGAAAAVLVGAICWHFKNLHLYYIWNNFQLPIFPICQKQPFLF